MPKTGAFSVGHLIFITCQRKSLHDVRYNDQMPSLAVLSPDRRTIPHFAQVALMFTQPRGATVKATGQLQVLSLDRRTFKRVMGPMENILKRNMKTYKTIAARNI